MLVDYGGDVERRGRDTGLLGSIIAPLLRVFRKGETSPIKRTLESVLVEIEIALNSVGEVLSKLRKRYEDLYTSAVKAVAQRNIGKATIYVNELVEIKKIILRLTISYNFLEQLKVRLGTLNELDKAIPLLVSLNKTIEYLKPQIAPIVPGVAVSLEKISSEINAILGSTSMTPSILDTEKIRLSSREAEELMKKIVEDAVKTVDTSLPKLLPELSRLAPVESLDGSVVLPSDFMAIEIGPARGLTGGVQRGEKTSVRQDENVYRKALDQGARASAPRRDRIEEVEERLIDYVVARGGFLDINDFCKTYGYSREDVMAALDSLVKKGRINIVNKGS